MSADEGQLARVWCYADVWEQVAERDPSSAAIIHGHDVWTWKRFNDAANALAARLLSAGLGHQAKVGVYMLNSPVFLVGYAAAYKAGLAPFNVNYRYGTEELHYLFDNADAEAVVFQARFAERIAEIRGRLPKVRLWIAVEDGTHPLPDWAVPLADVLRANEPADIRGPWGRSEKDVLLIYTGGTTGMPKGVLWPQSVLAEWEIRDRVGTTVRTPDNALDFLLNEERPNIFIACPLMHGTGFFAAMGALCRAGTVSLLPSERLDAELLLDEVQRVCADELYVVGLAFCMPLLEALDRWPGRWRLPALKRICSSGAMWSRENKQGLLRHLEHVTLVDSFASSEAFGMGTSLTTAAGETRTAEFVIGPTCAVFTEDGRRVTPGSGERGMVAVSNAVPLGYYKDPEKSARTFPFIEGRQWAMPGDWAEVNADGSLKLLGRGSQCINTGGEKVFPEEVEEVLKRHPTVRDAAVLGVPDPRFGERICALIELQPTAPAVDVAQLQRHVREHLADYKTPRAILVVESVNRAANGKLDYKSLKALAIEGLGTLARSTG